MAEQIFSSIYNATPAVAAARRIVPDLVIQDVTMREGQKRGGGEFGRAEKIALAKELDALGIGQIQVGFPGTVAADIVTTRAVKEAGVAAPLEVIASVWRDDWRHQIDAAVESGADWVLLTHPASQIRLENVHHVTPEQVKERTRESVSYAVDRGILVRFSCTDMTRTELDVAIEMYLTAKECGARRISISDTVGSAGPGAIAYLVSQLGERAGLPVHVHCHNELGLALANSLAAVEAGATMIDVSVNGLGDHCGNTSLEELAIALTVVAGVETGLRLERLNELSRLVEEISAIPVPPNKPVVGAEVFARKIPNGDLSAYATGTNEAYAPELVGQRYRVIAGDGLH
ncbi:MAG: hypothetical protein U0556_16675 [Dehalococcoidia bacterium]